MQAHKMHQLRLIPRQAMRIEQRWSSMSRLWTNPSMLASTRRPSVYSLNLLRQALLNNELTEEQSRHLRLLSLSTRSQTVGLWDCGTQTPEYGPAMWALPGSRPPTHIHQSSESRAQVLVDETRCQVQPPLPGSLGRPRPLRQEM